MEHCVTKIVLLIDLSLESEIDNEDTAHPTLIVHVDRDDAASLADRIEDFLQKRGARTERERHADTDVRILATLD